MVQRKVPLDTEPDTEAVPVQPALFENSIVACNWEPVMVPLRMPLVPSENCVLICPVTFAPVWVHVAVVALIVRWPPKNGSYVKVPLQFPAMLVGGGGLWARMIRYKRR